jgi:hypothetical protein
MNRPGCCDSYLYLYCTTRASGLRIRPTHYEKPKARKTSIPFCMVNAIRLTLIRNRLRVSRSSPPDVPTKGLLCHEREHAHGFLPTPMVEQVSARLTVRHNALYEMSENTAKPQGDIRYVGERREDGRRDELRVTAPVGKTVMIAGVLLLVVVGVVAGLVLNPIHCVAPQPVEQGNGGPDRAPEVIPFARLHRGREEGRKGRGAVVLGKVEDGPVHIQLRRRIGRRRQRRHGSSASI